MNKEKIFTVAWDFYPKVSGESVVCRRSLTNSIHNYDIVSGYFGKEKFKIDNCDVYPIKGEKYLNFTIKSFKLFKKLNKLNNYKVLYTRVFPTNSHFTGTVIKLFFPNLKWIVYFSDPVWNSPFISPFDFLKKDKKARPRYIVMKVMGIFSKIAIKKSDMLIFNNVRLAKYILGGSYLKYQHKVEIVPYGHEGVNYYENKTKLKKGKFCFAHVGQIYGERNLDNIVKALILLKDKNEELYGKLCIFLVGMVDEYNLNLIRENNLTEVFEIVGEVSYEESLQYMKNADCLILLDTNFKDKRFNIFTPSKVFDYLASGNLIFAITEDDTATTDVTKPAEILMAKHDCMEIYNCIVNILTNNLKPNLSLYETFDCKNYIAILDRKINELVGGENV